MKEVQNLKDCMGSEVLKVYIPEFVCGFVVGAIAAIAALIVIAICSGKDKKESEGKKSD